MLDFGVTVPNYPLTWQEYVGLMQLAERNGFEVGWTFDSHINGYECYPLVTLAALNTTRMKLGLGVTQPGTREPTVTASAFATLHDISGGRMVMGFGRGDSALRMIGLPPVRIDEFERSIVMIRELMNGRPVEWNGKQLELAWAKGRPEIPIHVAAYGPKALGVAGRVGDGVVIQLADPDIVEWLMAQARRAAEEAGRDPGALKALVYAPAFVSDDLERAREETRWFPAMVSNHIVDLLRRVDESELPPALWEYVKRRSFYDYKEHGKVGARHAEFVDDETCDRFSILGTVEQHVEKLRRLEEVGVAHVNVYLLTNEKERIVETYGREIIPRFAGVRA